jgi:hypothetical protein
MDSGGNDANSLFLYGFWRDAEGIRAPSLGKGQRPGTATRGATAEDTFGSKATLAASRKAFQPYALRESGTKRDDNFL